MGKNCLYCGTYFMGARSNKKYCSDNCKQMAYFKRNGLVLSGTVKSYVLPVGVREENVKYDSSEPTVKYDPSIQKNPIDLSQVEKLLSLFAEDVERKFDASIEKMKKELVVKCVSKNPDAQNVKYDFENKGNGNAPIEKEEACENGTPEIIHLHEGKEEGKENNLIQLNEDQNALAGLNDKQHEEEKEEESDTGVVKNENPSHEMQKLKTEIAGLKKELLEATLESYEEEKAEEQYEKPYQWIESRFIKQIEKQLLNENKSQQFNQRIKGWNYPQLESVNWINLRLRCLVESIIKLNSYASIDKHTLFCLHDAFFRLVKSNAFKTLPENYPYMELIKEIFTKVNALATGNTFEEKIKFKISEKLKTRLVALRYEMMKFIPAVKFSEMDFIETGCLAPIKKKEEEIKKTPDWYWRYKAMTRKEERQAA